MALGLVHLFCLGLSYAKERFSNRLGWEELEMLVASARPTCLAAPRIVAGFAPLLIPNPYLLRQLVEVRLHVAQFQRGCRLNLCGNKGAPLNNG